ncbi:polysaccharide deacetylase family protein [Mangrovivirga cuniculi]|nr:polysaccharide deacetylase family protein [Mangrovivirga cuniculi]
MKNILLVANLFLFLFFLITGCDNQTKKRLITYESITNEVYKDVVCFVYHRFGDHRFPSTNISLSDFEAHLKYLKDNNFEVVTFSEALDYIKSGSENKKVAVITIDDGYKSFFNNGLPLLKKYDFPATLFVNSESVGGKDYMTWGEINKANNEGVEIGNHTHTHEYFLNIDPEDRYTEFEKEITISQQLFEVKLGHKPETFAYPFGEYDNEMKAIVKKLGFKGAAAQNSGVIYSDTDLMECPRFPMSESYADINSFISKANMKPLKIIGEKPSDQIISKSIPQPVLELKIQGDAIKSDEIQCFIQGAECEMSIQNDTIKNIIEVELKASSSILLRRRTLYTLTAKNSNGDWCWFSHLWVNPSIN